MSDDNLEKRTVQAVNRMLDFYPQWDLERYVKFCSQYEIKHDDAMLFLDGQTRADYYVNGVPPYVGDYMVIAYKHFIEEDKDE